MVGDIKAVIPARATGMVNQSHPGLLRSSACLVAIAGNAGANYILPRLLSTSVAGENMVQGKLMRFLTTVLAGMPVAIENLKAG